METNKHKRFYTSVLMDVCQGVVWRPRRELVSARRKWPSEKFSREEKFELSFWGQEQLKSLE